MGMSIWPFLVTLELLFILFLNKVGNSLIKFEVFCRQSNMSVELELDVLWPYEEIRCRQKSPL